MHMYIPLPSRASLPPPPNSTSIGSSQSTRAPSFVIFNNLVESENQILFPHQFFLSSTLAICLLQLASQMVLVLKNLPANVGDLRDTGLIPGWGRSLGEGNYSSNLPWRIQWAEESSGLWSI